MVIYSAAFLLLFPWPRPCITLQIDTCPFSSNRLHFPERTPLDLSFDMPVFSCRTVHIYTFDCIAIAINYT